MAREKKERKDESKDLPETEETVKADEAETAEPEDETTESANAEEAPEAAEAGENAGTDEQEALKQELDKTKDQLLRTLAEYDNFRRRSQKEKESLFSDVKADTIAALLPVIDNFERAAATECDYDAYKKGIEMTVKQLLDQLGKLGIESFGAEGDPFDPAIHNGVMHEDNEELPENSISAVFMKGYKLGDKVIRHATVKVAN
ncbi:MAG: nucleotide exchange factor GrpE [Clostridia bacterium]|nr:nucleotide exchange factor GrpE [Clostridia bacterium]